MLKRTIVYRLLFIVGLIGGGWLTLRPHPIVYSAQATTTPAMIYLEADTLWLADAEGQRYQELAAGLEDVDNLSWSPDGNFILAGDTLVNVKTVETQLLPVVADLTTVNLTAETPVAWSADGQWLAYVGQYQPDGAAGSGNFIPIKLVELATRDIETVEVGYQRQAAGRNHTPQQMFWGSDDTLVVNVVETDPISGKVYGQQLYRLRLSESKTFKPLLAEFSYLSRLSVAADNDTFLVAGSTDGARFTLYQASLSGGSPQSVSSLDFCDTCQTTWLPDRRGFYLYQQETSALTKQPQDETEAALAKLLGDVIGLNEVGQIRLSYLSWPAAEVTTLAELFGETGFLSDVTLDPTGETVAFHLYRADTDETRLYFLTTPHGEPQLVATFSGRPELDYRWTANGQQLWLFNAPDTGKAKLYDLSGRLVTQADVGAPVILNPTSTELVSTPTPAGSGDTLTLNPTATATRQGGDTLNFPTATPSAAAPSGLIAFTDSGQRLYTIKPDGSELTDITPLGMTSFFNPQWSPDGTKLIYDGGKQGQSGIWTVNADGSDNQFVVSGSHPSWGPSGQRIAFDRSDDGIFILDLTTGQETLVTKGFWRPAWSPDGKKLLFWEITGGESDLYLVNPDGSGLQALTDTPSLAEVSRVDAWSPDSRYILFLSNERSDGQSVGRPYLANTKLETIDLETNTREIVTNTQSGARGSWSPDGRQFVYSDGIVNGTQTSYHLFIMNNDGTGKRQLTSGTNTFLFPSWGVGPSTQPTTDLTLVSILPPTPLPPTPTPVPPTATPIPPTATPVPVCPNPNVQINVPYPYTTFRQRYIRVVGNANIANFNHYRIEYSTVNDGHSWNFLFRRDTPITNGELMTLDTSTVPRGSYGLRLTVVDHTGNYPEPCEVWFTNGY